MKNVDYKRQTMGSFLPCAGILLGLAILLAGCETEQEHHAKFVATCTQSEFSAKQCEILYSVKRSSEEASESAAAASFSSGMAMGMSAASAGARR